MNLDSGTWFDDAVIHPILLDGKEPEVLRREDLLLDKPRLHLGSVLDASEAGVEEALERGFKAHVEEQASRVVGGRSEQRLQASERELDLRPKGLKEVGCKGDGYEGGTWSAVLNSDLESGLESQVTAVGG